MKGLGVPVHNQYGLRPATVPGTRQLQPLLKRGDLDARGWLEGVETFNFHPHLPHYAITASEPGAIHLLAQQPIDLSKPHPFTEAGHREFNMFLWMPPKGERAGDILLADSTIFTTLFGGDESLEARRPLGRPFRALAAEWCRRIAHGIRRDNVRMDVDEAAQHKALFSASTFQPTRACAAPCYRTSRR